MEQQRMWPRDCPVTGSKRQGRRPLARPGKNAWVTPHGAGSRPIASPD